MPEMKTSKCFNRGERFTKLISMSKIQLYERLRYTEKELDDAEEKLREQAKSIITQAPPVRESGDLCGCFNPDQYAGTLTVNGNEYHVYLGEVRIFNIGNDGTSTKRKFTLIEI